MIYVITITLELVSSVKAFTDVKEAENAFLGECERINEALLDEIEKRIYLDDGFFEHGETNVQLFHA